MLQHRTFVGKETKETIRFQPHLFVDMHCVNCTVVFFGYTKSLVHAFITSKVDYCNSLLRPQRVLTCVARAVFKSNKFDHITPLLKELRWLPIEERIKFKIILILFEALKKQAPNYINDFLSPYKPSRSLRSSTKNL